MDAQRLSELYVLYEYVGDAYKMMLVEEAFCIKAELELNFDN